MHGGCQCKAGLSCKDAGKHPRITEWQNRATADEMQIRTWWQSWPDANVGVACGEIVLIDVDVKEGAAGERSLTALESEIGALPDTVEARTPTGGRHLLFRAATDIRNSASKIGAGLDVRGFGGYFVAPPSRTEKGEYRWGVFSEISDTPLAELPPKWLERMANGNGRNGQHAAAVGDVIGEGGRNAALTSKAGSMRRAGFSEAEILSALLTMNVTRCRPPLEDEEVRKIAASVARYDPAPPKEAPAQTRRPADSPGDDPATDKVKRAPRDAADLLDKQLAPMRWLIEGILPEGLVILAGRPKMGKSWMALGWMVALTTGGVVLGKIHVEPTECLYLALEDNERRLQDRLRILLQGARPGRGMLHYEFTWSAMGAGGLQDLRDWLSAHPECRFVAIDTLARVRMNEASKGGNSYLEDYKAMSGLQRLALSRRIAIVMVHHLRQAESEDPLDLISGTSGLTGAADGAIVLKRQRGAADAVLFGTHRDLKDNFELALRWDRDLAAWAIMGTADEFKLSEQRRAILETLRGANAPMSPNEVAKATKLPAGSVRNMMSAMFKEGAIVQPNFGTYAVQ